MQNSGHVSSISQCILMCTSVYNIYFQLISCAINAACLACLDSGIDMRSMFAAVSCFLTDDEELTLVAPVNNKDIKATFIFVFDNCEGKIIASHTKGSFIMEHYIEALNLAREESTNIFEFFSQALLKQKR